MKSFIIKAPTLLFLPIVLLLFLQLPLHAESSSPMDIVNEWMSVYGIDQDRASELTTLKFREGIPKKTWADETFRILKKGGYKHVDDKFLGISVRETSALVVIESTIETVMGKTKQKEFYLLNMENNEWLIEDILVEEEETKEKDILL
jgi:hypothetical protein